MIKIAITGGIGSGKSYVGRLLQQRGIPVYVADDEAKRLTASDPLIRRQLIGLAGPETYHPDGSLNRAFLADYLFAGDEHVKAVNSIIHPRVKEDFAEWVRRQAREKPFAEGMPVGRGIVALESAILYEAGFEDTVDAVVMVYAPREVRLQRAMQRDGATWEQVERRMAAQMDDEEKCRRASFVVVNDGVMPLEPALDALILQLRRNFPHESLGI